MSELTLTLIRLGFLAVLWLFVLSAVSVIRSDMFGARVEARTGRQDRPSRPRPPKPAKPPKAKRGDRHRRDARHHRGPQRRPVRAARPSSRSCSAAAPTPPSGSTTTTSRPGTRGSCSNGEDWYVEDLGSTNGTYIGSQRITTPTLVAPGVAIRVGKTIVELKQ